MAKGITPVIALILLLVITIVIVGFTFTIFQNITSTAGTAAENQTEETSLRLASCIRLESVNANGDVYIRNCGSSDITAGSVSVYARPEGGSYTLLDVTNDGTVITGGGIGTLLLDYGSIPSGPTDIRIVSAAGISDVMNDQNIQTSNPNVFLDGPASGTIFPPGTTQVMLRCHTTDPQGISKFNISTSFGGWSVKCEDDAGCDDEGGLSGSNNISYLQTDLVDGMSVDWRCEARDVLGNEADSSIWNFRIDTVPGAPLNPPAVTLTFPANGDSSFVEPATVNFDCTADANGANLVTDLSLYTSIGGTWHRENSCTSPPSGPIVNLQCAISNVLQGTYNWNCRATDNDTQTDYGWASNWSFTVNPAAPVNPPNVQLRDPADTTIYSGVGSSGVYVNFTCDTSDNSAVNKVELFYSKDGGNFASRSTFYPFKKNILAPNADFEKRFYPAAPAPEVIKQYNETFWPWCKTGGTPSYNYCRRSTVSGIDNSGAADLVSFSDLTTTLARYFTTTWNYTGNRPLEDLSIAENILKPNTKYFVSGYIRATSATTTGEIRIYKGDNSPHVVIGAVTGGNTWTYVSGEFTTGPAVVNASINLTRTGAPQSDSVYFDNIQVEEIGEAGQSLPTNFTDNRTYMVYEETNNCYYETSCENVKSVSYISGIFDGGDISDDNKWGELSESGYDSDVLVCWAGESCSGIDAGKIRLSDIPSGTYEIAFKLFEIPNTVLRMSPDDGSTWFTVPSQVLQFTTLYHIANVTVTAGFLDLTVEKTAGAAKIDRIYLIPQGYPKQFNPMFSMRLTQGVYNWNCQATDDESHAAMAPQNFQLTINP